MCVDQPGFTAPQTEGNPFMLGSTKLDPRRLSSAFKNQLGSIARSLAARPGEPEVLPPSARAPEKTLQSPGLAPGVAARSRRGRTRGILQLVSNRTGLNLPDFE